MELHDNLENTILKVVKAFKEKDQAKLNQFVSKENGIITLFRRGVFDEYQKSDKVDFENPVPKYLPYFDFSTDLKLSFESLPTFDCDKMEWSKTGLFCDTTKVDNLLSKTARSLKKYRNDNISEKEIESFKILEKESHRIVLCDENEGELIFYLTFVDNKWCLIIIDRVTSDCSA